ncbi:putative sodium-coupled neutral amino acid transporter 10 isoform X2 [Corticium candelabrum]|uniref:putative sodium-coupled neutral amino acid transporter 10 isoform X2 n=1 Tax=Corticium candelabrum TaxID=121492 RepID=UPI002E33FAEB|nr:putative sodium-coupled neutral amino acid transporter 10 isoform X2 [Corticium candelabrum]
MDWPFVINLGNSIVSVSFLAMPYCMKQCGVLLGSLLLALSAMLSRMACDLLLRAALVNKKRSYELLALATFGTAGKLLVELCISALLLFGGCVAYLVVIGDVVPAVVASIFGWEPTWSLRAAVLVILAFTVALPLSLMKNIESLHGTSTASFFFYISFAVLMLFFASSNLATGQWAGNTVMWDTSGIFHSIPIFSLSFICQTQLFLLYNALPEPSMKRMLGVVDYATYAVTIIYLMVGLFGYLAFTSLVNGDVLKNFGDSLIAMLLKLGFCVSALVSYPVFVFPSRSSIHSLIFTQQTTTVDGVPSSTSYIPHNRFVYITLGIVVFTLVVAIFIPNVETVLGLTGASAGTAVCYLLPGLIFLKSKTTDSTRMFRAKSLTAVGVICLVASTYSVLSETEHLQSVEAHMPAPDSQAHEDYRLKQIPQPRRRERPDQTFVIDQEDTVIQSLIDNNNEAEKQNTIDKTVNQQQSDIAKSDQHQNPGDNPDSKENFVSKSVTKKVANDDDSKENVVPVIDQKQSSEKRLEPPAPQAPEESKDKVVEVVDNKQDKTLNVVKVDGGDAVAKPADKDAQLPVQLPVPAVENARGKTQMNKTVMNDRIQPVNRDLKTADQKQDDQTLTQNANANTKNKAVTVKMHHDQEENVGTKVVEDKKMPENKVTEQLPDKHGEAVKTQSLVKEPARVATEKVNSKANENAMPKEAVAAKDQTSHEEQMEKEAIL